MEHSITPLSSALGEGEANRVGDHPNHVDAEAKAEAKANKQRRRFKPGRTKEHTVSLSLNASPPAELISFKGLRITEQDPGSVQTSRPFQVWRVDEPDDCPSKDASSASKGATATHISPRPPYTHVSISIFTPERAGIYHRSPASLYTSW